MERADADTARQTRAWRLGRVVVGSTPVWFWLKFEHQIATGPNLSVVQLYYNAVGEGPDCLVRGDCSVWGQSENTAILHLTPIPEPASYAMLLGAVGVVEPGIEPRRHEFVQQRCAGGLRAG